MKTLIVTGVHQAEAEFGERVVEKYKELYGVPDSVKISVFIELNTFS